MMTILSLPQIRNKGFTLVEVLVVIGIAAFGILVVMSTAQLSNKTVTESSIRNSADAIRRNYTMTLNNPTAWQNTVNDLTNASLACIRTNTPCPAAGGPFRLRNAANNLVYDPVTSASNGFSPSGAPCNTFSLAGNDACPLRLDLAWSPICPPAPTPCVGAQVQIQARMLYRNSTPSRNLGWNEVQFGINSILALPAAANYNLLYGPSRCPANSPSQAFCPAGQVAKSGGFILNFWNGSAFQAPSVRNEPIINAAGVPIGWSNTTGGYACDNWAQVWVMCGPN